MKYHEIDINTWSYIRQEYVQNSPMFNHCVDVINEEGCIPKCSTDKLDELVLWINYIEDELIHSYYEDVFVCPE